MKDLHEAERAHAAGRLEEALARYDRILSEGIDEFIAGTALADQARLYRGYARWTLGRRDAALADAEAAIAPQSAMSFPDAGYALRALIRMGEGRFEDARSDYALALEKAAAAMGSGQRIALVRALRAHARLAQEDIAGAQEDLQAALASDASVLGFDLTKWHRPFWLGVRDEVLPAVATRDWARAQAALETVIQRLELSAWAQRSLDGGPDHSAHVQAARYLLIAEVQGPLRLLAQKATQAQETARAARRADLQARAQAALQARNVAAAFDLYVDAYRQAADTVGRDEAIRGLAAVLPLLPAPPQPDEELRRLLVRAKVHVDEKEYRQAIDLYWQAIQHAPWFAQLHHDRALLIAEQARRQSDYDAAIEEMRRFLLLAPNAPQARVARDKIYEWEVRRERLKDSLPPLEPSPRAHGAAATAAGSDCFIATAAYGSWLDPHVASLRRFRDEVLMTHEAGRLFVAFYYRHSPPIAEFIRQHEGLRALTRAGLAPLVAAIEAPWLALAIVLGLFSLLLGALHAFRNAR